VRVTRYFTILGRPTHYTSARVRYLHILAIAVSLREEHEVRAVIPRAT
jgi:hypothetical protein